MNLQLVRYVSNAKSRKTVLDLQRRLFSVSSSQKSPLVMVEEKDGLRKITMCDNKTRNALSLEMMDDLEKAVNRNKSDKELRCIAIAAAPGPVFSAGHNLKQMTRDKGRETQTIIFEKCTQLMLSLRKAEVPVVAVVDGLAAAAGCQLVATCDFCIASEKAMFSTPGANFGIFCSTPGVAVSRAVPRSLASYMVLTGLPISAQEALQGGLVSKVVPDSALDATLKDVFKSIKSKSRSVLTLGKQFFNKQLELPFEEALRQASSKMVENLQFQDCQEGLSSFVEKRKPIWNHTNAVIRDT